MPIAACQQIVARVRHVTLPAHVCYPSVACRFGHDDNLAEAERDRIRRGEFRLDYLVIQPAELAPVSRLTCWEFMCSRRVACPPVIGKFETVPLPIVSIGTNKTLKDRDAGTFTIHRQRGSIPRCLLSNCSGYSCGYHTGKRARCRHSGS